MDLGFGVQVLCFSVSFDSEFLLVGFGLGCRCFVFTSVGGLLWVCRFAVVC